MQKNVAFQAVLAQLAGQSVTVADLSMSYMRDAGCAALMQALTKNQSLVRLHLQLCYISDKSCDDIAAMLRTNRTLVHLDLCSNKIGKKGAGVLLAALQVNTTLQELELDGNSVPAKLLRDIAERLAQNRRQAQGDSSAAPAPTVPTPTSVPVAADTASTAAVVAPAAAPPAAAATPASSADRAPVAAASTSLSPPPILTLTGIGAHQPVKLSSGKAPLRPVTRAGPDPSSTTAPAAPTGPVAVAPAAHTVSSAPAAALAERTADAPGGAAASPPARPQTAARGRQREPVQRRQRSATPTRLPLSVSVSPERRAPRGQSLAPARLLPRNRSASPPRPVRRENLPLSALDRAFIDSGEFSASEAALMHMRLRACRITVTASSGREYTINTRYMPAQVATAAAGAAAASAPSPDTDSDTLPPGAPIVLCLHGFGDCCTWATWTHMVEPLHTAGCSLILLDLPGFGLSSGRDVQTGTWKADGPDILAGVLDAFRVVVPVSVLAHCGGAATFMRTFVAYPDRFAGRHHVLHNCVTGEWAEGLDRLLMEVGSRILVTWAEDEDHMRACVAYKHLKQLRATNYPNIKLVDICEEHLPQCGAPVSGMGRLGADYAYLFRTPDAYRQAALDVLLRGKF